MSTDNIAAMPESEEEIAALVSEIASGLNAIAKSEAQKGTPLKKAAPPPPEEEGAEPSPEPSPEAGPSPDMGASPEAPPAEGMPADDGMGAGGPPPGAEGAPPGGPEAGGAQGGAPSVEELVQLYSQLPDDQFEAHFMAIQTVAEQKQGAQGPEAGPSPEAPPPSPGPSASAGGPPPGGAPMAMSEHAQEEINGLKKSVSLLTQALETVTNAPLRKSVTRYENGIAYIPYQGPVTAPDHKPLKKSFKEFSKAEVHERLKEVTADPKLQKSDRELINGYYNRSVALDKLEKFFQ